MASITERKEVESIMRDHIEEVEVPRCDILRAAVVSVKTLSLALALTLVCLTLKSLISLTLISLTLIEPMNLIKAQGALKSGVFLPTS